jgi:integrase
MAITSRPAGFELSHGVPTAISLIRVAIPYGERPGASLLTCASAQAGPAHDTVARQMKLVALDVEDVSEDDGGLRLVLRRSKTEQDAEGATRGLPYGSHPATCPVRAWRRWLDVSGIKTGPAFRSVSRHGRLGTKHLSDRALADIVKRRAAAVGLAGTFAGHSLRAGFATEAYAQGTPELAIMRHGRWRSASVMRGYVEEGSIWNDNAAARLGL